MLQVFAQSLKFNGAEGLEAPLPCPVPGLGATLEIPLRARDKAPPLAVCVAPGSSSWTGGYALDPAEPHGRQHGRPPELVQETGPVMGAQPRQRTPVPDERAKMEYSAEIPHNRFPGGEGNEADLVHEASEISREPAAHPPSRPAKACVVETSLASLPLAHNRKRRAQELSILATEHASLLREIPPAGQFDVLIIADREGRCGLWVWLDAPREAGGSARPVADSGRDGGAAGEAVAMADKSYIVEDADKSAKPQTTRGVFPGTLAGLLDALDAARYRSAAGTPKALIIVDGKNRQIIRRFEGGKEVWSVSTAEVSGDHEDGPQA